QWLPSPNRRFSCLRDGALQSSFPVRATVPARSWPPLLSSPRFFSVFHSCSTLLFLCAGRPTMSPRPETRTALCSRRLGLEKQKRPREQQQQARPQPQQQPRQQQQQQPRQQPQQQPKQQPQQQQQTRQQQQQQPRQQPQQPANTNRTTSRTQQSSGGAYHGGVQYTAPTNGGVHPSGVPQHSGQV